MEFMKKFRIGSGLQNFHIRTPLQGSNYGWEMNTGLCLGWTGSGL